MAGLDLAVISNCTVASAINPTNGHVWLCFPRIDADLEFDARLGGMAPETGYMEARQPHQNAAEQRHLPNTALVCTFWYIDALVAVERRREAPRTLFENELAQRNHIGWRSADVYPETGELCGNFPQTYSQVGLILAAMRLSRSWEEGLWRAS